MSFVTKTVEVQYRQKGHKSVVTSTEAVALSDRHAEDPKAILATLRLLHPQWEDIKVMSVS
ncbi:MULTISPECIES: hypothetical protein [Cupriavidus]|jgi:hypothetical protein|uniref:Uncharacterized protein n=2 Tax=Cupriavidus TaxID=106589 RepID=A0ABN7Q749_9BURK|nr:MULTISPECIES: hypothetical protein [Cupriavidus]QYY29081.1 hypothetical protein K2O51_02340 [Cupriavidus pinatubonensis]TPQ37864.1 hypothetical protein C2U69_15425 [Cupriavidus pinatubonensis]CAG2150388.1 hypothetical protein LMG26411_03731 [Cupriavidus numazuensis]CAG9186970.1 hypothetical protein LMG23994_06477 [Cupriavidus pinatubonensis]